MLVNPSPALKQDLKQVLIFTQSQIQGSVLSELQQILPQANLTLVDSAQASWLLLSHGLAPVDWHGALDWLRQQQFDAVLILTPPGQSP